MLLSIALFKMEWQSSSNLSPFVGVFCFDSLCEGTIQINQTSGFWWGLSGSTKVSIHWAALVLGKVCEPRCGVLPWYWCSVCSYSLRSNFEQFQIWNLHHTFYCGEWVQGIFFPVLQFPPLDSTLEMTSFNLLSAHLCSRAVNPGLSLGFSWLDFTFTCLKPNDALFYQQNIKTSLKSIVLCLLSFFMHIWNSLQAKRIGDAVPCAPQLNKSCCFGKAMAHCQNTIK